MKEIERILEKGVISEDYLQQEEICEFLVTENRKKLWAVMLDMIYEFDKVCKKHGLKYYLIYGSLLGAVRHKGFIPWDDDFDVAMPRSDYEKFITLSNEFKMPYFLQIPETDREYFYSFAKIRNTNTTGIVQKFKYANYNHGIWISIFPLDYWDDNGGEERYLLIRKLAMHNSTYMRIKNPNLGEKDKSRVEAYLAEKRNPMKDYEEIQRLASSCKDCNSRYVMTAVITQGTYRQKLLNAKDFSSVVYLEFEGIKVSVPVGYRNLLSLWYGDYMSFPPIEKRGIDHAGAVFDADISYKEYLEKEGVIL